MQNVVITGGSRGIGAAAVRLFSGRGDRVWFLYEKNHAAAEAVAADARARVAAFLDRQRWKGWSKAAEAPPPEGASR